MPQVPYIASANLQARSGGARLDPQAFAAPGAALGRGFAAITDALSERMEAEARARRAIELAKTNNAATAEANDLVLGLERDPDWMNVGQKFDEGIKQIKQKYAGAMKDPLARQEFELGFDRAANPLGLSIKRKALEMGEKDALSTLEQTYAIQAQAAANAPNELSERQARAAAAKAITDMRDAGWIDPFKATQEYQRFNSRVDEAKARSLITKDPDAAVSALNDPNKFRDLTPVQRAQLTDNATARADTALRRRIAEQERLDRLAEKNLRRQQEDASKALWDRWGAQGGRIDIADVRAERARLSEADYRALLHAAVAKDGAIDQAEAVRELKLSVDTEQPAQFERRAYGLLQAGRITLNTYKAEVERNRSNSRDDAPASPYKSGREYVKVSLDPGQLGGDPTTRQPLAIAQQRALSEYDSWAEANPGVDRVTAMKKAEELTGQFQNVGFSEMRLSLRRPRGFGGSKNAVSQPDIDKARADILRGMDSGTIDQTSGARELDELEIWERVLDRTKPAGAKK